jgi:glycosyltransferase involved in cell wall biosynthesis
MKLWQWEETRGFKILRLPLFPDHSQSSFRRLLNYTSFTLSASTLGVWKTRAFQPDVIFAYFAPLTATWTVRVIRTFHRVPVVYWITDLWPENFRASGMSISDGTYSRLRNLEDWGYRQAQAICVDSPGYKKNLLGKGVPEEKIHIVAEWADEQLFYPVERDPDLGKTFGLAGRFNIIYGGNLGPVQKLETVIEAARLLTDLEKIQFVFIGDGTAEQDLKSLAEEYNLHNVRFIPRQPMERMRDFFAWADALLVHLKRTPIFELQLPSKVLAYMACERPILNGVAGTVAEIIDQAQCGRSFPPEDPEALAGLVREFYALPADQRKTMGQSGRATYLAQYSRSIQVQRLEQILQDVVEERKRQDSAK